MESMLRSLEGHTAIVVGGGEGLTYAISKRFAKVIHALPHKVRKIPPAPKVLSECEISYTFGSDALPASLPAECDLLILAFQLYGNDDPVKTIERWIPVLRDRGKMVLIEWYGGPNESEEEDNSVHRKTLNFISSRSGEQLHDSNSLFKWLRMAGLVHPRYQVQEHPSFFTDEDLSLIAAESLAGLVQLGDGDSELAGRLRTKPFHPAPVLLAWAIYKSPLKVQPVVQTEESGEIIPAKESYRLILESESLRTLLTRVLGSKIPQSEEAVSSLFSTIGASALPAIREESQLSEVKHLPAKGMTYLLDILEIGRRLFSPLSQNRIQIFSPLDAYMYLRDEMTTLKQEQFRGLFLNVRGYLVADDVITLGTLTSVQLHPREVFGPAIEHHCHSVLVAHNHPSGDPAPSTADIHMTRGLAEAARFLQIELIDHIIIGAESFVSMKEKGYF